MLRAARHAKILEIISHKEVETQEELCAELMKINYVVTQATISRDIRDLHLFKVAGIEKKYRYAYISEGEGEVSPKMKNLFRDCVISIKSAQNLIARNLLPPSKRRGWIPLRYLQNATTAVSTTRIANFLCIPTFRAIF